MGSFCYLFLPVVWRFLELSSVSYLLGTVLLSFVSLVYGICSLSYRWTVLLFLLNRILESHAFIFAIFFCGMLFSSFYCWLLISLSYFSLPFLNFLGMAFIDLEISLLGDLCYYLAISWMGVCYLYFLDLLVVVLLGL